MEPQKILKKIYRFEQGQQKRLNNLYEAYIGKYKIMQAVKKDGKPNNKLINNFAHKIVNDTVGYYLGEPIRYKSENTALNEQVEKITEYNDDAFHNTAIGEDLSTFGRAAEIVYYDKEGWIRYAKINPMFLYIGYSEDVDREIEYAIRWYDVFDDDDNRTRYVEYYDQKEIVYYTQKSGAGNLNETERKPHYFGIVPINVFENNKDGKGDFEDVISLIDAYNVMQSENVNDFQSFADAILFLRGVELDEKDEENLRDKDILQVYEPDGDAQWLVKSVNDSYVENMKNRLEKDIYQLSGTVNMSDESFGNNLSGVAIKYKLMSMESRVAKTERYFKKALQRRFEIICNFLNLRGGNFDYKSIDIIFKRNIPVNITEYATVAQQLTGIVSKETLLTLFPFVTDIDAEMKRLENESDFKDIFTEKKVDYNGLVNENRVVNQEIKEQTEENIGKVLNGAQTQSLIAIIQQYSAGVISIGQAVSIISVAIGISKEEAKKLLLGVE